MNKYPPKKEEFAYSAKQLNKLMQSEHLCTKDISLLLEQADIENGLAGSTRWSKKYSRSDNVISYWRQSRQAIPNHIQELLEKTYSKEKEYFVSPEEKGEYLLKKASDIFKLPISDFAKCFFDESFDIGYKQTADNPKIGKLKRQAARELLHAVTFLKAIDADFSAKFPIMYGMKDSNVTPNGLSSRDVSQTYVRLMYDFINICKPIWGYLFENVYPVQLERLKEFLYGSGEYKDLPSYTPFIVSVEYCENTPKVEIHTADKQQD